MANFVASPLSPAIAFILGITYLVCLAVDLKKENNWEECKNGNIKND